MRAGTTNSVTATSVMYSCHCHCSEKSIQHWRRPEARARRLQRLQRSYKTQLRYLSFQTEITIKFFFCTCAGCQLHWPRGLRHEPFWTARTVGTWIRIPLEAWMSVCVYSVYVVLCVGSGLATGWSLVQGLLPTVYRIKKLKTYQGSQGL
jgi:hypothetical protein